MAGHSPENPTYKLIYFDAKALAEPIRILFAYGGIDYEDIRIPRFGEEWPKLKPTFPMGQLPVLDVDGVRIYQSLAITRYVAKRVGLAGSNDWESLQIDIAVDNVNDFRAKIATAQYEPDENVKQQKMAQVMKEVIPFYLEKLESMARENNGYLALGRLTWADIYLTGILDYLNYMVGFDLTEHHLNLKNIVSNVSDVESIKAWIERRPTNIA